MSSGVTPFPSPAPIHPNIPKNPHDAIPPVEDLEKLQADLITLRQRALDRAKKASDDLKTIEESMRRLKEKEKGKGKAVDKVKKERGRTYHHATLYVIDSISFSGISYISRLRTMCVLWPNLARSYSITRSCNLIVSHNC